MPIEVICGEQAWAHLKQSELARWPTPRKSERLYPIATPVAKPKFQIQSSDRIFCIGSCFAREIEQAFARLGYDVLSIIRGLPQSNRREGADAGMFNKYTLPAVLNELSWALDPSTPYDPRTAFVENEKSLFEDYQLSGPNYADAWEQASAFREAFNASFARIREADLVVLTLGLSEAWFDKASGYFLNVAPSRQLVAKYPGRFELRVLAYEETLAYLEQIYALLGTRLRPGHRVLITVSPVPLLATFRDQDVLVANAYSKAVLRTAVEKFQGDKTNVSYFPSYEFVTLSNPLSVWNGEDYRHVDRHFVEHIMTSVLSNFCAEPQRHEEPSALARAVSLYRGKFYGEASAVLAPYMQPGSGPENPKIILRWGMIQRQLKQLDSARDAYRAYLERCPDDDRARTAMAQLG